ncbi:hypothetical protein G7054_g10479 [Neopestalotiopsis clavispora]|nr:hypothetical protein G7054_g10479 [Neopestalotiopsis clavispora]
MAGVEVITLVGLIAAVSQLIDYGSKFSAMVQDGRDAPMKARKFAAEAKEVLALAQSINDGPQRYENMQPFVDACIHESRELMEIASSFIAQSTLYHSPKGFCRKIHSVLIWKKKHEQIRRHLAAIERHKTSLLVCSSFAGLSAQGNYQFSDLMLKISTTELSENEKPSVMKVYSTLPDSRRSHSGYEAALGNLRTALAGGSSLTRVVVTGLSGVGKSHLALAYADALRISDPNISVFWIRASQEQTLVHSYLEIAIIAGFSRPYSQQQELIRDVLNFLDSPGMASLLIYDNLGDSRKWTKCLEDYLPRNQRSQAIFTVRDPEYGSCLNYRNTAISLHGLEPDTALKLLLDNLSANGVVVKDAADLVSTLGYIPLAILQAASFISATGVTIKSYLTLLLEGSGHTERLFQENMIHEFGTSSSKSFFEAFSISLQSVKGQDQPAFDILALMSCVHSSMIPSSFLMNGGDDLSPSTALIRLRDLSLIDFDDGFSTSYGISPILQLLVRDHLKSVNQYSQYLNTALRKILAEFPGIYGSPEDFAAGTARLSHAEELLKQETYFDNDSHSSLGDLSTRITSFLLEQGSFMIAGSYAEKATRLSQSAFGSDSRKALKAKSDIATILRRRGKLDEAEEMTQQILDKRTILFGVEDFDSLASMNNLAIILQAKGHCGDAEIWYRKVVEVYKKVAGPESSDLMQALENLALALQDQEKYDEAKTLYQRVLSWRRKHFGDTDSRTINTKINLGGLMQLEKQWEEAWTLQTEVFRSHTQRFGRMHPQTIKSQANMAIIMHMQGYLQAAEPTMRQAVEHLQLVLGSDNQDTLTAMRNLAILLRDLRQYDEALEVSWKTWNHSRVRFGPRHPETLASRKQNEEMEWYQRNCRATIDDLD